MIPALTLGVEEEYYLVDRGTGRITVMASTEGGVEIETVVAGTVQAFGDALGDRELDLAAQTLQGLERVWPGRARLRRSLGSMLGPIRRPSRTHGRAGFAR